MCGWFFACHCTHHLPLLMQHGECINLWCCHHIDYSHLHATILLATQMCFHTHAPPVVHAHAGGYAFACWFFHPARGMWQQVHDQNTYMYMKKWSSGAPRGAWGLAPHASRGRSRDRARFGDMQFFCAKTIPLTWAALWRKVIYRQLMGLMHSLSGCIFIFTFTLHHHVVFCVQLGR
jgi:hypothetical protein